jgi:hypothetical protein
MSMRKAFAIGAVLALPLLVLAQAITKVDPSAQFSGVTTEVLVTTAAAVPVPATALAGRRALEIQNLGPNAIWCSFGTPVATKARKIASGDAWAVDASDKVVVRCIASSADQVTGAATIANEVR